MSRAIGTFSGRIKGAIQLKQMRSYVKVSVDLSGFPSDRPHGLHIHEFGDLTDGCMSCGGHFKKGRQVHGVKEKDSENIHAGDLINNITPVNRKVRMDFKAYGFTVDEVYGRSFMLHEQSDDYGARGIYHDGELTTYSELAEEAPKRLRDYFRKRYSEHATLDAMVKKLNMESKKTGNAGGRMSCCVIGRMQA